MEVNRKEKLRRLKVVRSLVEGGSFQLPVEEKELENKAIGIAKVVRNFPPTKMQLETMSCAYMVLSPALRAEGDKKREEMIKAARRKYLACCVFAPAGVA